MREVTGKERERLVQKIQKTCDLESFFLVGMRGNGELVVLFEAADAKRFVDGMVGLATVNVDLWTVFRAVSNAALVKSFSERPGAEPVN